MNPRAVALSLLVTAAMAAPALAQSVEPRYDMNNQTVDQQQRRQLMGANVDAFVTTVPPLTYSVQDDRHAAVCYLDDAVGLIDLSRQQLRAGNVPLARVALMGASGKLTTAYLLNFRDRAFSQRVEPMTMSVQDDLNALNGNINASLSSLDTLRGQVASIGQQQLAMLPNATSGGGGGGGGTIGRFERLNFLAGESPEPNDMNQLNVPNQIEVP
jgi:hypothetical protein